jgi:hydroxyacylglutathione hydrolase
MTSATPYNEYRYLIIDLETKECACVDPVEPAKIIAAANECGATITHVLTTHSHWDHAGGNEDLVKELGAEQVAFVVGGVNDAIPMCTHPAKHGDKFGFGKTVISVLDTPW